MKLNIKRVAVLTTSLFLVMSSIAFAAPVSSNTAQKNGAGVTSSDKKVTPDGKQKCCHKHNHKRVMFTTLKDKFGITEVEFENAKKSGKSIFDLTKAKGFTEDQVKNVLLQERYKHLDEAVSKGKIDKAKAELIKSKMKIKIGKWDGKIKNINKSKNDVPKDNISN